MQDEGGFDRSEIRTWGCSPMLNLLDRFDTCLLPPKSTRERLLRIYTFAPSYCLELNLELPDFGHELSTE